ncbi:MAG: hypothetical protein QOI09_1049 [Chloroflexota bacterium]|jgi:uncharacterized membrane protein YeaQ/YmgE (transglycosylase-associated protein family)|nr:hypothetical protein [Chloroflexota bacterium]
MAVVAGPVTTIAVTAAVTAVTAAVTAVTAWRLVCVLVVVHGTVRLPRLTARNCDKSRPFRHADSGIGRVPSRDTTRDAICGGHAPRRPFRRREVAVGIIAWIVLGAIAGWITNLIMGGGEGVILTIILGIVGAVVGGWLAGTVLKVADVTGVNIESIVVAVIGAIIVVAVYRAVSGRRTAM